MLLFDSLFLFNGFVVALQNLLWLPPLKGKLEIPVEHLELFLQSFASIIKQSILTLEFCNLLGLLCSLFSLELDLDP